MIAIRTDCHLCPARADQPPAELLIIDRSDDSIVVWYCVECGEGNSKRIEKATRRLLEVSGVPVLEHLEYFHRRLEEIVSIGSITEWERAE